MKPKYDKKRPTIPADVKRAAAMESGHTCAVTYCTDHTYIEYHHIDENRENNSIENLIYLCDKHHKMAHNGIIDRKALRKYKKLNTESISELNSNLSEAYEESDSLDSSLSLEELYKLKCEDEEILVEFCHDVVNKSDFLTSTVNILSKGIIEIETLNRVLGSLAEVFQKTHLKHLFRLDCMLYDHVDIDDSLFKQLKSRGLSNKIISQQCAYVPRRSSLYLSRVFFTAFIEEEIDPISFQTAVTSPSFASYCGEIDSIRTRDLMLAWSTDPSFKVGFRASDAIYCAKLIAREVDIDGEFRHIRQVVKRWVDNDEIYQNLIGNDFARENVRDVVGYNML